MIPIRNLYHMLLYAWDLLEQGEAVDVSNIEGDHPIDLLAYVLIQTVEPILKQGLDRSYVSDVQTLPTIRGAIDFQATFASGALSRRELVCVSETLSPDAIHNQILKATLYQLSLQQLSKKMHGEVMALLGRMGAVDNIRLSRKAFASVRLHRNTQRYALPVAVCRMLFDQLIVSEGAGTYTFASFLRDEVRMRRVFEHFVRNLLRRRLAVRYSVGGRRIDWAKMGGSSADLALLPTLNMDVLVERTGGTLIIDTKYTEKSLVERWTTARFRSEHMYQIFAYAENYAVINSGRVVSGMLLYPAIGSEWHSQFELNGRTFHVATIGLDQDWSDVEASLLKMIDAAFPVLGKMEVAAPAVLSQ